MMVCLPRVGLPDRQRTHLTALSLTQSELDLVIEDGVWRSIKSKPAQRLMRRTLPRRPAYPRIACLKRQHGRR